MRRWNCLAQWYLLLSLLVFSVARIVHSPYAAAGQQRSAAATTTNNNNLGFPQRVAPRFFPTDAAPEGGDVSSEHVWGSFSSAWIYPGVPGCDAASYYQQNKIHTLRVEYFTVSVTGQLWLNDEESTGCGGFTMANALDIRQNSIHQFLVVSSPDYTKSMALLSTAYQRSFAIKILTSALAMTGFNGIELDFEDWGAWSTSLYNNYKAFLTELRSALKEINATAKISVTAPAIADAGSESVITWRHEEIEKLVDYIVVMALDYQYIGGAGTSIAPNAWVQQVVQFIRSKMPDEATFQSKVVVAMPSFGYHGPKGTLDAAQIRIDTRSETLQALSLIRITVERDANSFELRTEVTSTNEGGTTATTTVYYWQDQESITRKRELIEAMGVKHISVWHLGGGNEWFSASFSGKIEPRPEGGYSHDEFPPAPPAYSPPATSAPKNGGGGGGGGGGGSGGGGGGTDNVYSISTKSASSMVGLVTVVLGGLLLLFLLKEAATHH